MTSHGPLVAIDPGHGGHQPGRIGRLGNWTLREADVTWSVSVALQAHLESRTVFTRRQSSYARLSGRAELANEYRADIFVSVHCNAVDSSYAEGFEVWHFPGSAKGEGLALGISLALQHATGRKNRGIKPQSLEDVQRARRLTVLNKTVMPAVIVELDFLSNAEGQRLLGTADYQNLLAAAVAAGIKTYFEDR